MLKNIFKGTRRSSHEKCEGVGLDVLKRTTLEPELTFMFDRFSMHS